jgi:hypothetical protein
VCQLIADEHIDILALNLAGPLILRLVVDNPLHAAATLREHNYQVEERDVIFTTAANNPGSVLRLTRLIAEAGINVEYLYATTLDGQPMASIVVGVPDAARAAAAAGL